MAPPSSWEENAKYVLEALARLERQIDIRALEISREAADHHTRLRHDVETGFASSTSAIARVSGDLDTLRLAVTTLQATRDAERDQIVRRGAATSVAISSGITVLLETLRRWLAPH